jgi:hypothetical protein
MPDDRKQNDAVNYADPRSTPVIGRDAPLAHHLLGMAVVVIPLIVLAEFIAYYRLDVVDDQLFAYFGWRILHGATVYVDVWDNKPPGIYWINALGMGILGGRYLGVIVLCGLSLLVAHAAFFVASASAYRRGAAALNTILLGFFLTHAYFTAGSNRTETFLVAAELLGVAFYARGFARPAWWMWLTAGFFCGVAFLFKQVGLAAWGCMGLHLILLVVLRRLSWRVGLQRCLLLLAGVVIPVALAAVVLALQGALDDALWAMFGFNEAYFAHGDSGLTPRLGRWMLIEQHIWPILTLPALMAVAAWIHAGLWWLRPKRRPAEVVAILEEPRPVLPLAVVLWTMWLAVATWGALLSPHAFRHYVVPAIPPLLLLAGYLINVLRAESRLATRMQQNAWVVAVVVALGYFSAQAFRQQQQEVSKVYVQRIELGERAEWEIVGAAVKELTETGDHIQCFGYMPGVYLYARRPNALRFTTTEKVGQVRGHAEEIVAEIEAGLRAAPPVMMVLSTHEYYELHGVSLSGRPPDYELASWMDANYQIVREVSQAYGGALLLKRRDRVDPAVDGNLDAHIRGALEDVRRAVQKKQGAGEDSDG